MEFPQGRRRQRVAALLPPVQIVTAIDPKVALEYVRKLYAQELEQYNFTNGRRSAFGEVVQALEHGRTVGGANIPGLHAVDTVKTGKKNKARSRRKGQTRNA